MTMTKTEERTLTKIAGQIKDLDRQAHDLLLEIGRLLTEARDIHARPGRGGGFSSWVSTNCPFSLRIAYYRIDTYEKFGTENHATVARFDRTALYKLAAPEVPQKARNEALRMAKVGRVKTRDAEEIIAKHGGKQATLPEVRITTRDAVIVVKPHREDIDLAAVLREAARQAKSKAAG